jgi:hypothetical protein
VTPTFSAQEGRGRTGGERDREAVRKANREDNVVADEPTKTEKTVAYPVRGYTIELHPEDPTMCILVMLTAGEQTAYALLKEHAESLAAALTKHAAAMPARTKRI